MKKTARLGFLLTAILVLGASFHSCTEDEVMDHPLVNYWTCSNFQETDHQYNLWIKNDSVFSFEIVYRVYDGVSWDSISGMKTYTGKYYTEGKKLVLISDSMFIQNNLSIETIDTIAKNQTIFEDCEYQITGNKLRIDYTIILDTPPSIKRTMYFYIMEY